MVLLFALLFAPMIAGLEWVSSGRQNVGMQDACRYAMEQIRRELGEAVYVHETPGHTFSGPDGVLGNYDDVRVINYSQIVFNPPARDGLGKVYHPPRPATSQFGYPKVVRYAIRLVNAAEEYSDLNPFALYRQEFVWNSSQTYALGSFDSSGTWQAGTAITENALTPKLAATFVPTTTVYTDGVGGAGQYPEFAPGYVPYDGSRPVMYLFNGLQFEPRRVVGEELATTNGVVYKADHGAWDGASLSGAFLGNQALARCELDPRVMLFAWDAAADTWSVPRMDSYQTAVRPAKVRWSADGGVVTCGQQARQEWPAASGNYLYCKIVDFTGLSGGWNAVSMPGDLRAIYPSDTATAPMDTANAPIAYRIDPSVDIGVPALIEPGTVKVRVVAVDTAGRRHEIDLKPTTNFDQSSIRGDEYCVQLQRQDYAGEKGTTAVILLSRLDPPRPTSRTLFGATPPGFTSFQVRLSYYYRRNYTYDPQLDAAGDYPFVNDAVKADYSVRTIQNVSLTLQAYTDLVDDGSARLIVPADEHPNEVSMREQIVIRNFGR